MQPWSISHRKSSRKQGSPARGRSFSGKLLSDCVPQQRTTQPTDRIIRRRLARSPRITIQTNALKKNPRYNFKTFRLVASDTDPFDPSQVTSKCTFMAVQSMQMRSDKWFNYTLALMLRFELHEQKKQTFTKGYKNIQSGLTSTSHAPRKRIKKSSSKLTCTKTETTFFWTSLKRNRFLMNIDRTQLNAFRCGQK